MEYNADVDCKWVISVPSGEKVRLRFSRFKTWSYDIVTVYDGPDESAPALFSWYGSSLPEEVISTSNNLLVTFTGNGATARRRRHSHRSLLEKEGDDATPFPTLLPGKDLGATLSSEQKVHWVVEEWSHVCRGGKESRTVYCVESESESIVPDALCRAIWIRPEAHRKCDENSISNIEERLLSESCVLSHSVVCASDRVKVRFFPTYFAQVPR